MQVKDMGCVSCVGQVDLCELHFRCADCCDRVILGCETFVAAICYAKSSFGANNPVHGALPAKLN